MDFIQSTASNNEKMLDARPRDFISMIYLCLFVRPWILFLWSHARLWASWSIHGHVSLLQVLSLSAWLALHQLQVWCPQSEAPSQFCLLRQPWFHPWQLPWMWFWTGLIWKTKSGTIEAEQREQFGKDGKGGTRRSARAGIIQQSGTSGVVIRHWLGSWALGFYLEDTFGMCFSGPGLLSLTYSFWSLVGLSQAFGFYLQNPLLFFLYFALFLPWGQARDSIQGPLVSDQLDSIPNLGLNPWFQAKVYKQRVCMSKGRWLISVLHLFLVFFPYILA